MQAQATRGGAIPSGTLAVTSLHISSESPCKYFNAASGRREKWFRKQLCSDVRINFRTVHANAAMHADFFPIGDSGSPTHKLIESRPPSATVVLLIRTTRISVAHLYLKYRTILHK